MEGKESWENADLLDKNSDALAQPAQLSSVEELRKKTGSADRDMWHTICASEKLLLRFWFCSYRECFAMEKKKNYTYGDSLKIGVGQQKIVLFSFFFSVLIVIVHACLSREGDMFVILFWNGKEETVAVRQKKEDLWFRPSASKSVMLTLYATGMSGLSCVLRGYVGS